MAEALHVEVVVATSGRQTLLGMQVEPGTTAGDAIERSGLQAQYPDIDFALSSIGVWGRITGRDYRLRDGDRIEIYRPLLIDPRDARRQLAEAGLTMGRTGKD